MRNLTLKQSQRLADGIFGLLSLLCGLGALAGIVLYGNTASDGAILFGLFVLCGSLVYPVTSICKN